MKKLHYLSAFLLLAAGATSSYAQKWVVNDGDEYLTSIPVGVPVALHSVTGNAYLCGTGNGVSNITDNCAFVFEDAGNGTYRLKQYETNLYLGDQELRGTSDSSDTPPSQNPSDYTWMTENPNEAFTFFANNPNPEASGEAGEVDYETAKGLTSATYEAENITRYFIQQAERGSRLLAAADRPDRALPQQRHGRQLSRGRQPRPDLAGTV